MNEQRWLGIDFSGNHLKWRGGCTRSNIWIADARGDADGLRLHDVRRVQQLAGSSEPFDRLVALLAGASYAGAGIDAPFSIPDAFAARVGGHVALLKLIGTQTVVGRPFIDGSNMVRLVAGVVPPLMPPKPMRATDTFWASQKVNVRSPMWTGGRPGAPMTAACLTLLHRAARPIWPWSSAGTGLLIEAFPAGQLKTWGLPHEKYNGTSSAAVAMRKTIVDVLATRIQLGKWRPMLLGSPDALDSVLCAFAALAVTASKVAAPSSSAVVTEGWVAVHP